MKNILSSIILLICMLLTVNSSAQIVNFTDTVFKRTLLLASTQNSVAQDAFGFWIKVDVNNNSEIEESEALLVSQLYLSYNTTNIRITSLEGIDKFKNLKVLSIEYGNINNINLSSLSNLDSLMINNEINFGIKKLNVSGCTKLRKLTCNLSDLDSLDISNLSNLESLSCSGYEFTSGWLIGKLKYLNISGCTKLKNIDCSANQLTSINFLGNNSIEDVFLSHNKITNLNLSGSSTVKSITLDYNPLKVVNVTGCTLLNILGMQNNDTIVLDSINVSGCTQLNNLVSHDIRIPLGATYSPSVKHLNISGCINFDQRVWYLNTSKLITFNATGCTKLERLEMSDNFIKSININGCTNLNKLVCGSPNLDSLNTINCPGLEILRLERNSIKNLDLRGCRNLIELQFVSSNAFNLDASGLLKLTSLDCRFSPVLTILNASGCVKLSNILATMCPNLYSIFMKGNNVNLNANPFPPQFEFYELRNLRFLCADTDKIEYIYRNGMLGSSFVHLVTASSDCNSTSNESLYAVQGNTKLDLDNNGCTSTDIVYPNLKFKVNNATSTYYIYSDNQGNYAIPFSTSLDTGAFTITPQFFNSYFNVTPLFSTISTPNTITQQFCVTPNGVHNDLSVTIIPTRAARAGFSDATYKIVYKNLGNTSLSGIVQFNFEEDKQDYVSATISPTTISNGQLNFAFSNFNPFETREITVTMRTNSPTDIPPLNANDIINLSVSIGLANGIVDENISDNVQNLAQIVVNSFDPNDKTCLEGNIITPSNVGGYINYVIRFENNGTTNAQNIIVSDLIDLSKFDINTLQITSSSHPVKTVVNNGNKVQFWFDNINLPYLEPNNHGYVAFKIKTKNNLIIGDTLKNKADIYFDYNLPVKTNITNTKIDITSDVKNSTKKEGTLRIYPNPSNGNFSVNFESKSACQINIKITDLYGKVLYGKNLFHNNQSNINLNISDISLPDGTYLINISSEKGNWVQKLSIVK